MRVIELNKIYNEDCIGERGMCLIPDKSIDMVLCDLPYGTTWAKWDEVINFNLLWNEYKRICKGAIVLFSSQPFTTKLIHSNLKQYKYSWYWIKNIAGNYLNAKKQPLRQIEEINVFNKHNYFPQGIEDCNKISRRGSGAKTTLTNYNNEWEQKQTNYPKNILTFPLDKEKFHPTQKPVALCEYLVKTYTQENEIILDNCFGSASTIIASINTNRNFIGFELNNDYYNIARNRINTHIMSQNMQDKYNLIA